MPASAAPAWKKEVNRRVAEHRSRKSSDLPQLPFETVPHASSRRAAEAAARVAERFANAPSYGDVLASDARAALRAAKAASKAALEAQAPAQQMLAGLEAVSDAEPEPQLILVDPNFALPSAALPIAAEPLPENPLPESLFPESTAYAIQWQPELPPLPAYPPAALTARANDSFSLRIQELEHPSEFVQPDEGDIEIVEPVQSIHANLIQFPRELVAARKARPRLAEGPYAAVELQAQLSIFEVDPATISTEPAATGAALDAPSWTAPTWSDIELDPQFDLDELPDVAATEPAPAPAIVLAPVNRRLLAALVDSVLIAAALLFYAMLALSHSSVLPGIRSIEIGAVLGFVIAGAIYQVLFLSLATATPGMKYAHIRLVTFSGKIPTRAQRIRRFFSLLLSILPVGLGLVWAVFDEDHMSWHDRLSHTYPQKDLDAVFIR